MGVILYKKQKQGGFVLLTFKKSKNPAVKSRNFHF